jgi:hypothetical protein
MRRRAHQKSKIIPTKIALGALLHERRGASLFFCAALLARECSLESPETEFCNLLINFNAFDLVITCVYGNNAYGAFFIAHKGTSIRNLSALRVLVYAAIISIFLIGVFANQF